MALALLRPGGTQATPVNVVAARTGTLVKTVNGTGTARAEVSRTVSFGGVGTPGGAVGQVASVDVRVGDEVRAGQPLARLDTTAARRDLDAARAALTGAQADLLRAQASAREGQLDLERQRQNAAWALEGARSALEGAERTLGVQRELLRIGGVSRQDLQTAQTARDEAARRLAAAQADLAYARARGGAEGQAAVTQARAALESARVRVQNLEAGLVDAELRAPTGGVVSAVNVSAGNPVPATQAAVEITDPARLYLEVPFDETRASDLRVGQPASVQFDALPRSLRGTVHRIEPVARSSGQVASVLVHIRLPGARDVKPGFTGTATVTTRRLEDAVILPLETTDTAGAGEGERTRVWRVTPNPGQGGQGSGGLGVVRPLSVTLRERNASSAAVQGAGAAQQIRAGDLIVTPAPGELKAGDTVRYTLPPAGSASQERR